VGLKLLVKRVLLFIAYPLVFLYLSTIRFRLMVKDSAREIYEKDRFVFTNYHNQIIPLIHYFRKRNYVILVSKSRDGEITDYFIRRYKYATIRGSSTSGGTEALSEIHSRLKGNIVISITFDGPKGPIYKIKKGIIWLISRNRYPLLMGYCYFSWAKRIRSWDGLYIPYPFSKVLIVIDGPVYAAERLLKGKMESFRQDLEERMWDNYYHYSADFRDIFGADSANAPEIMALSREH